MLNVPEANSPTFRKVMESLGGEDYAYYAFDVKNIENKDSKKESPNRTKVFVPQAKRALATEQIANALIDDGVNVVTKSNELDVIIPNTDNKRVIRIEIKPPSEVLRRCRRYKNC